MVAQSSCDWFRPVFWSFCLIFLLMTTTSSIVLTSFKLQWLNWHQMSHICHTCAHTCHTHSLTSNSSQVTTLYLQVSSYWYFILVTHYADTHSTTNLPIWWHSDVMWQICDNDHLLWTMPVEWHHHHCMRQQPQRWQPLWFQHHCNLTECRIIYSIWKGMLIDSTRYHWCLQCTYSTYSTDHPSLCRIQIMIQDTGAHGKMTTTIHQPWPQQPPWPPSHIHPQHHAPATMKMMTTQHPWPPCQYDEQGQLSPPSMLQWWPPATTPPTTITASTINTSAMTTATTDYQHCTSTTTINTRTPISTTTTNMRTPTTNTSGKLQTVWQVWCVCVVSDIIWFGLLKSRAYRHLSQNIREITDPHRPCRQLRPHT